MPPHPIKVRVDQLCNRLDRQVRSLQIQKLEIPQITINYIAQVMEDKFFAVMNDR